MFESLTKKLTAAFDKLRKRGVIGEADLNEALREVRIALLEADVALPVVKDFIETLKAKALGQEVVRSVSPAQMIIKIVHEHLLDLLGREVSPLDLDDAPPVSIMMVGLQGSGKTTSSSKLALFLKQKLRKKVLLVSLDIYRPAAQLQLENLAKSLDVLSLPIVEGESPIKIVKRAQDFARLQAAEVVIFDTAGRLQIDEAMMEEVSALEKEVKPREILLVADAMTGQDAVRIAQGFSDKLSLTGLILTRVDGDSRGGAALSMRSVTGKPIKFMGVGEKPEQFELFDPHRLADRILDMGDIVSLVERAIEVNNQEDTEKLANRFKKGHFDLNDMAAHFQQMMKMGGLSSLMSMLPGAGQIKQKLGEAGVDDKFLRRQLAIIQSMTPKERRDHNLLNASRKRRVALGSGQSVMEVNRLLKQFEQMQKVMKQMKKLGPKALLGRGMSGLFGQ
jgi:signal recognition particle subunit SRP54